MSKHIRLGSTFFLLTVLASAGCSSPQPNNDASPDVSQEASTDASGSDIVVGPDGGGDDVVPTDDVMPTDDGGGDPAQRAFCQQITDAFNNAVCGYYSRCCNATEQMDPNVMEQLQSCMDTSSAVDDCVAGLGDSTMAGRTVFDASHVASCVAAINTALHVPTACNRLSDLAQSTSTFNAYALPECQAVVRGTQPMGSQCVLGFECQSGFCAPGMFLDDGGMTNGSCIATPTAGSDCSAGQPCAAGMSCVNGMCRPIGGAGAVCEFDGDCQAGLYCSDASVADGGMPVCAMRLADGMPCTDGPNCQSGRCDSNHCAAYCAGGGDGG